MCCPPISRQPCRLSFPVAMYGLRPRACHWWHQRDSSSRETTDTPHPVLSARSLPPSGRERAGLPESSSRCRGVACDSPSCSRPPLLPRVHTPGFQYQCGDASLHTLRRKSIMCQEETRMESSHPNATLSEDEPVAFAIFMPYVRDSTKSVRMIQESLEKSSMKR